MNISEISEKNLVTRLRERLTGLLGEVSWVQRDSGNPHMDEGDFALVYHSGGNRIFTLLVDCKKEPRPSVFALHAQRREARPRPVNSPCLRMLGAPFITPRLASVCKEAGWGWIDLAGNCRIDIPGLIHIERSGNGPVHKRPTPPVNFSSPEVARVLRVLLAPQRAGETFTQRGLRDLCDPPVSIGLVNKVVNHLKDEAYLREAESKRGGVRLVEPLALLETWREDYAYGHHRRLAFFTLLKGEKLNSALQDLGHLNPGRVALASFSAAAVHAPFVRQPRTWLYATEEMLIPMHNLLEAKEVDSGDNLQVLVPSDEGVFADDDEPWMDSEPSNPTGSHFPIPTTSPLQTYLDLWHAGGRGREAAEAVMERVLAPAWKRKRESTDG